MKWLITVLLPLAAALTGSTFSPNPSRQGGHWMLEATIPLSQVRSVEASPEPGIWAAMSHYESWLYRDTTLIANGTLRAHSRLQFTDGGKLLAAQGLQWDPKEERAIASKPMYMLDGEYDIASALILPGDTVMAALVTAVRRKGVPHIDSPTETPRNQIILLDLRTGNTLHVLAESPLFIEKAEFATNGHLLACANERLLVWDIRTGTQLADKPLDSGGRPNPIAFSPDGKQLLTADPYNGTAKLWDTATWQPKWSGQLAGSGIRHIAFGNQPGQVYFASERGGLYACRLSPTQGPTGTQSIAKGEVLDFSLAPDGHRLYVAGGDAVRIFRVD